MNDANKHPHRYMKPAAHIVIVGVVAPYIKRGQIPSENFTSEQSILHISSITVAISSISEGCVHSALKSYAHLIKVNTVLTQVQTAV